jgi:pre-rRNA-processing protein TSR4
MVLLLQLNGDLPEVFTGHERRLYIFSCRRKTCRRKEGSVRTLRGVRATVVEGKKEKKAEQSKIETKPVMQTGLGESLFGAKPANSFSNANPFSTSSAAPNNPFSNPFSTSTNPSTKQAPPNVPNSLAPLSDLPRTFASALSLNNFTPVFGPVSPKEPWPAELELPPPYPLYYLVDADYETLDNAPEDVTIPQQAMDIDEEVGGGSSGQKEDKDTYESTIDKTFQKFADRLAQNPEQVIRYEFKGQPLLCSKIDAVGKLFTSQHGHNVKITVAGSSNSGKIPNCSNCGAGRAFEVQLTPHAIVELESDEMGMEGMEWQTILVGVCEKDCQPKGTGVGEVGYVEEWAGVQWEEELGGKR